VRGREPLSPWSQVPAIVKVLVLLTSPRPRLTAGLHRYYAHWVRWASGGCTRYPASSTTRHRKCGCMTRVKDDFWEPPWPGDLAASSIVCWPLATESAGGASLASTSTVNT